MSRYGNHIGHLKIIRYLKQKNLNPKKMPSLIMCKSLSDTHNGDSQTGRTQKLLRRPLSVLIIWTIQMTSI